MHAFSSLVLYGLGIAKNQRLASFYRLLNRSHYDRASLDDMQS